MWTAEAVLVCALTLLGRNAASFPPIEFVATPHAGVSSRAEAYVRPNDPHIYIVTARPYFQRAQRSTFKCGEYDSLRKLASVVVHEEWHVRHGANEADAYAAQLTTLVALRAGPGTPLYNEVRRAMRYTLERQAPRVALSK